MNIVAGNSDNGYVAYYANFVVGPNDNVQDGYVFRTAGNVHTLVGYIGEANEIVLPGNYNGENYTIGEKAFRNNTKLISVTIPDGVTSIGSSAFYGCSRLASVTIPNSVTSIGSSAFSGCSTLTSIEIPNTVTSIGSSAFYNCI